MTHGSCLQARGTTSSTSAPQITAEHVACEALGGTQQQDTMPEGTQWPRAPHLQSRGTSPPHRVLLWSPGSGGDHLLRIRGRWDSPGPSGQPPEQGQPTRETISKILEGAFSWHDSCKPSLAEGGLLLPVPISRHHPGERSLEHVGFAQKALCGISHQIR